MPPQGPYSRNVSQTVIKQLSVCEAEWLFLKSLLFRNCLLVTMTIGVSGNQRRPDRDNVVPWIKYLRGQRRDLSYLCLVTETVNTFLRLVGDVSRCIVSQPLCGISFADVALVLFSLSRVGRWWLIIVCGFLMILSGSDESESLHHNQCAIIQKTCVLSRLFVVCGLCWSAGLGILGQANMLQSLCRLRGLFVTTKRCFNLYPFVGDYLGLLGLLEVCC